MGPRRVLWDNYLYFIPSWTRLWLPLIGIGILGTALTAIVIRKRDVVAVVCLRDFFAPARAGVHFSPSLSHGLHA